MPTAEFSKAPLNPYEGMTFTVALPKGAIVPSPKPILEERFNFTSAFRVTPATGGISGGLLAVLALIVIFLVFKFGRDRRYAGSAVDAAYGRADRRTVAPRCRRRCARARRRWSSCRPTVSAPASSAR